MKSRWFSLNKIPIIIILVLSVAFNVLFLSYTLNQYSISTIYLRLANFLNPPEIESNEKIVTDVILPSIYTQDKEIGKHSFYNNVKTKEDFESWKKFFNYTKNSINNYPLKSATLVQELQKEKYTQLKYTMPAIDEDSIIFYELIPKFTNPPYPTVFIIPGSGNQGARDVIGEQTELSRFFYHSNIGRKLVEEGYAVYVIEHRGYGERGIDVKNACDIVNDEAERLVNCPHTIFRNKLSSLGINLSELLFSDASLVLKHIHSLEYVGSDRIAIAGLSLGGGYAQGLSGHNPEIIKATIVASATHAASKGPLTIQTGATNLLCCDSVDTLIAAIAPRPLYVSYGENEFGIFAWEAKTNYSGELLKTAYKILDAEDNLFYTVHAGKHTFDVPTVIEFLNNKLK